MPAPFLLDRNIQPRRIQLEMIIFILEFMTEKDGICIKKLRRLVLIIQKMRAM